MRDHFSSSFGGAIHGDSGNNAFELSINQSVISRNAAGGDRGAIGCRYCVVNISNSVIEFNTADSYIVDLSNSSGGIYNSTISHNYPESIVVSITQSPYFEIINSTFSENITQNTANPSTLQVTQTSSALVKGNTFINNSEGDFGDVYLGNTVMADNVFAQRLGFVLDTVTSDGFNILTDIPNGPITLVDTDFFIQDPAVLDMSELGQYGGIGDTHQPGTNSLDKNFKTENCELTDQKAVAKNNPACDVGAFQSGN